MNIKELRAKLGVSRERLAQLLGVSAMSVFNWEKGNNKPSYLAQKQIDALIEKVENPQ